MFQPPSSPHESKRDLAGHFGWWWREPAKALEKAFPETSPTYRNNIFRRMLNNAAFWYEATARREMRNGKNDSPVYEFYKPFNELPHDKLNELRLRWPTPPTGPTAFEIRTTYDDPFASVRPSMNRLTHSGVVHGQTRSLSPSQKKRLALLPPERRESYLERREDRLHQRDLAAMQERTDEKEMLVRSGTRKGWTTPSWFSFNLAECRDGTIVAALKAWLAAERQWRGIAEPKANKGQRNRSKRAGLSFFALEGIDVSSHLSAKAAKEYGYDPALISRMKAVAIAEWKKALRLDK